jgi:hypothetical protein
VIVICDGMVWSELGAGDVGRQFAFHVRNEVRHYGEWELCSSIRRRRTPVGPQLITGAIEDQHLAVERVERADAEVPMIEQITHGHVAFVYPVE